MSWFKRYFLALLSAIITLGISSVGCRGNNTSPAPVLNAESAATKPLTPIVSSRKTRGVRADPSDPSLDASACGKEAPVLISPLDHSLVVKVGSTGMEDLTEGEIHYLNLELHDPQTRCNPAPDGGPVTLAECEQLP